MASRAVRARSRSAAVRVRLAVRAMRGLPLSGDSIALSAADPLNLVGILVPGERVPAISGKTVDYRDGIAVVASEATAANEVAAG